MKIYNEVSADKLVSAGVQDVMRTPADGVNRNTWISWGTATLAVRACFDDESYKTLERPRHQILVNNADGKGGGIAFGTECLEDGDVSIATVSGWHPEGRSKLTPEQSEVFKELVEQSIASGLKVF